MRTGWRTPCREMRLPGFLILDPDEDRFTAQAKTTLDVALLAAELVELRELMVEKFLEIRKMLSQGEQPRLRERKAKRTSQAANQRLLPFLPAELAPISEVIQRSETIVKRPQDPSDELGLTCSRETWQRAVGILAAHALSVWQNARIVIRRPVISTGPDGSVDIYWAAAPYGLLVNVPANSKQPATYYGDDAANPDSNHASGKLDSSKPIDLGVLMWLAHTAQQ